MIHLRIRSLTHTFVLLFGSASFLLFVSSAPSNRVLGDSVRFSDRGVQVNMVPTQSNGHSDQSVASATCNVRVNQRDVMLHFAATPFAHVDDSSVQSDAILSATVSQQLGQITVSPQAAADQTNISDDDEQAAIEVGVSGNGRAQIQLQVGIDANDAHAGRHCTTVVMTVTAN